MFGAERAPSRARAIASRVKGLVRIAPPLALLASLASACGDLKTASPTSGDGGSNGNGLAGDGSGEGDGGAASTKDGGPASTKDGGGTSEPPAPGFGPGPHGSLPTGYCCTADDQCRRRHCADVGGGVKMCLDGCHGASGCTHAGITGFTCDNGGSNFDDGWCKPPAGAACIPQSQYEYGTKPAGSCCSATGDANAGQECTGGLCIAIGDGPFVCSNPCDQPKDCTGPFTCFTIDVGRKECIPANDPYTCN